MKSYLVEMGKALKDIGITEKQAEAVIREAIYNADQCAPSEARGTGWTTEDTYACCVGMCAQKINLQGQELMNLVPFAKLFDEMFTQRYQRQSGTLNEDKRKIRLGVLGAFNQQGITDPTVPGAPTGLRVDTMNKTQRITYRLTDTKTDE